jgi:hypothetical protein
MEYKETLAALGVLGTLDTLGAVPFFDSIRYDIFPKEDPSYVKRVLTQLAYLPITLPEILTPLLKFLEERDLQKLSMYADQYSVRDMDKQLKKQGLSTNPIKSVESILDLYFLESDRRTSYKLLEYSIYVPFESQDAWMNYCKKLHSMPTDVRQEMVRHLHSYETEL